jgi:RNA polymerase sigma-70 factor (ECF subfamily)
VEVWSIGLPAGFVTGWTQDPSEAEIVEGCRKGSLGAFEQVYCLHSAKMKSVALHMLQNKQDAEDAVQDAFLKMHRGIQGFQGQSSLTTWIYRILINCCYDVARRRQRRAETEATEEPSRQSQVPLRMALKKAIGKIEERYRMVFLLFEVEGLRHSEIAGILSIPEGTSRSWLFEAKRELKKLLTLPEKRP